MNWRNVITKEQDILKSNYLPKINSNHLNIINPLTYIYMPN